ncbi:MAG: hypothetical protein CL858_01205 [Cupriavidus sp.]|jgi:hypothetical protein|uniref:hypothetical protein n=1 Tax=Cupriavidus pauculus TaxID=82633 RepID=UPI0007806E06|nr:hypothetical protein [Cupriavidus pauculus]MBU64071.1 hypothetical protein [Cupriavidus sp.]KAB0599962.1 hypothetical protein F7R19_23490 [Cupriavidus pauculus]MBY4732585.1 hypothetical protein [Cupriavidus pauculus]MCM3604667.1 hypothetical protein [Cupriavidus pauculus]UAK98709.1 hypothetical protein K8O84_11845 [Cupriavidus pauculus]
MPDVKVKAYGAVHACTAPEALRRLAGRVDDGSGAHPGWLDLYLPTEPLPTRAARQRALYRQALCHGA